MLGYGGVLRLGFSRCGKLASCLVDWWEMGEWAVFWASAGLGNRN